MQIFVLPLLFLYCWSRGHAQNNGNLTVTITPNSGSTIPLAFACANNKWTIAGFTMNVEMFVNGVGPLQPTTATGLPTILMSWFVNGDPSTTTVSNTFNIGNVTAVSNIVTFTLLNNQPSVGGTFASGTCTNASTQPPITIGFTSNTAVAGTGNAGNNPPFTAVNAVPFIENKFPAANNAGGSPTPAPPTVAPTLTPTVAPTVAPSQTRRPSVAPTTATAATQAPTSSVTQGTPIVAAATTTSSGGNMMTMMIGAGVGGGVGLLAVAGIVVLLIRKRRRTGRRGGASTNTSTLLGSQEKLSVVNSPYIVL